MYFSSGPASAAGQAAAERCYQWEQKFEVEFRVADLPPGRDPAEVWQDEPELLVGAIDHAKPFLQYDITKSIMFKVSNVTSFALKPVSTPGNGTVYGTEFDGDIGYNGNHIFAGVSYGVLFPFSAMAHPANDGTQGGPGLGYDTLDANGQSNAKGDAGTAHTVQARLVLTF